MRLFKAYSLLVATMAIVLVSAGVRASAQQPPPGGRQGGGAAATNLKVLPKDTPRQALLPMMRGYTNALGVQCNHCHTEDMNARASDDNPKKDIARKMIKMTMDINATYLAGVGAASAPDQPKVTCFTCHRGQVKPATAAAGH